MKNLISKISLLRPKFLEKIDKYLLLNYPRVWATKIHHVIFYGLLVNIAVILFTFGFSQPNQVNDSNILLTAMFVEVGVFTYWFYAQSLFNVEENYGITNHWAGAFEVFTFVVCAAIITSPSVTMQFSKIYNTAYDLRIDKETVCEGPVFLEFMSEDQLEDFDTKGLRNLQKIFELTEFAANDGYDNILIEDEALKAEWEESDFFYGTGYIGENIKYILIDSGEATLVLKEGAITIIRPDGTEQTLSNIEGATVSQGDIIKSIDGLSGSFSKLDGTIHVKYFGEIEIDENTAVIVEDANKLNLIGGETIVKLSSTSGDLYTSLSNDTCRAVKDFITDRKAYFEKGNDKFGILALFFLHLSFAILGVFLLIVARHSNWRILLYTIINVVVLAIIAGVTSPILHKYDIYIFGEFEFKNADERIYIDDSFDMAFVIIIFSLIQSLRLINAKRYLSYAFMNLMSLPIELGVLLFIFVTNSSEIKGGLFALIVYFLIYLIYVPLQKKILIHLISLPKG